MITQEDIMRYPHHTGNSILGIKLIGGLTDGALLECIEHIRQNMEFDSPLFTAIRLLMDAGKTDDQRKTNPLWVSGRVLEEALMRGIISNEEFSKLAND